MTRRTTLLAGGFLAILAAGGLSFAAGPEGAEPKAAGTPEVTGDWTGTWGPYDPGVEAKADAADKPKACLDCTVVREGSVWKATFRGECGRPYKYTITMDGRQAGGVVLFKGTTDLGAEDGGVYDWIGRASGDKFVGFFTSEKYSGSFALGRKSEGE